MGGKPTSIISESESPVDYAEAMSSKKYLGHTSLALMAFKAFRSLLSLSFLAYSVYQTIAGG
jgi:hypothetical protein